ncbi:MAG: hypothetical protein HON47_02600, partial [Candidatus Diapherotrites archaeon]|nr:hypothetical protein [Candidatus Diapherotrites archaeon]
MPRKKAPRRSGIASSPGQLYRNITALGEAFDVEDSETVLGREKDHWYVTYCRKMRKRFPGMAKNPGKIYSTKVDDAVKFLGWKLSAGDFAAGVKGTAILGGIPAIIFIAIFYIFGIGLSIGEFDTGAMIGGAFLSRMFAYDMALNMFMVLSVVIMGLVGAFTYYIYSIPLGLANDEKNKALTYVPEMIGYMIMSMKLVPNLEKAIEFSAKHGRGKIAKEFKRLIWDFQIGMYNSISEGLDALAYRWGKYSDEMKEALMKVRASVMEPSESHRYQLLDKTMLEVLEGVKGKMEDYARSLNQPSVMLFYMGVLLPLILIIILPIGSAFSNTPLANPFLLAGIYCFGIPFIAFTFAKKVVKQRPPTYEPPVIPNGFEGLPKKWHMKLKSGSVDLRIIFVIMMVVGLGLSFVLSTEGLPPKSLLLSMGAIEDADLVEDVQLIPADKDLSKLLLEAGKPADYFSKNTFNIYFVEWYDWESGSAYKNYVNEGITRENAKTRVLKEYIDFSTENDPTKYLFWAGLIITLIFSISFVLYHLNIYKRRAQLKIIQMEEEFKESMYIIASRMGENKPVENALKQARDFLPDLLISRRVFGKTVENIELMGLPLEGAIFDPVYGSMKGIPSKVLRTAMQLLVDSVSLGVEVASRTLMSLSLQMENMDKVNKSLKAMVADVAQTMTTMALFIGPIVLGITVALQKIVMNTLAGIVADPTVEEGATASINEAISQTGGAGVSDMFSLTVEGFMSFATPLMFLI